ncbi:MAG: hypothetical protein JNG84_03640, partial [Archangium sp.]|nr:hypothetical protein [Archangium sp.]
MSRLMLSSCLVLSFVVSAAEPAKAAPTTVPVPKNAALPANPTMPTGAELNKVLYAFGVLIAQRTPIGQAGLTDAELKEVLKGVQDGAMGKPLAVKMEEYGPKIDSFLNLKREEKGKAEKKKGEEALAKFAKEAGAQKQPSG